MSSNPILTDFITMILRGDSALEYEINTLIDNTKNYKCSEVNIIVNPYTITGNNKSNVNYLLKYSNIVPNLFRQCWTNYTPIIIPNSCPILYYSTISIIYKPNLIDDNIIKAFFYYGFSDQIPYPT